MEKGKVYVFLTKCDYDAPLTALYPQIRYDEVLATKNARLRCEKLAVWKLLTCALERLGTSITEISPYKTDNGKWCSEKLYFSLSHSNSLIGVAISIEPVGIDIENTADFTNRYLDPVHLSGFLNKIVAKGEDATPSIENLITLWTAKESVYKMRGEGTFSPSVINTGEYSVISWKYDCDAENYRLALCTTNAINDFKTDVIVDYIPIM